VIALKVLIDTSVLVAAVQESHPHHQRAQDYLQRVKSGEVKAFVSAHTLAEFYATLTRMPLPYRLKPEQVWQVIKDDLLPMAEVVILSAADYLQLLEHLSQTGLAGGITYDAVIIWAALRAEVDQVVTLNVKHFERIHPAAVQIVAP
jgi:predicted nucleic acid-binding protein